MAHIPAFEMEDAGDLTVAVAAVLLYDFNDS